MTWIAALSMISLAGQWLHASARDPSPPSMREWAEANVVIPNGPYAGDRFVAALVPWTRLFLDELDSGRWSRSAATGCTQAGKTLIEYVVPTLYHLFALNETVACGVPTMEMASDKWRDDLLPVIVASPQLRELLPTRGEGSKGGTVKNAIQFRNGATLKFMAAGGRDAARKGFTTRVLAVTEVDELDDAGAASHEADKLTQMEGRLRAWSRFGARTYLESTPTIESGRIWQEITNGTNSRIVRPCPLCGDWVTPEREHLVGWQDAEDEHTARDNAAWSCPFCGERWTSEQHAEANQRSVLVHRGQTVSASGKVRGDLPRTDTFGFRFSAVDNHFVDTGSLGVELWQAARAIDQENIEKKLCQQTFAVPFVPTDVEMAPLDPEAVARRTIATRKGVLPEQCRGVAIGIDTGKRRLHWDALAATDASGRRVIEYGEQPVRADDLGTKAGLIEALTTLKSYFDEGWPTADGTRLRATQIWIDSGYPEHTDAVYQFCREANKSLGLRPGQEIYRPAKGHGAGEQFVGRYQPPRQLSKDIRYIGRGYHLAAVQRAGQLIVHIDGDLWKADVHDGLSVPADDPKAIVLYDAPSPTEHLEWSAQVSAERLEEKFVAGRGVVRRWNVLRRNNHHLDATHYAAAALDMVMAMADKHRKQKRQTQDGGWFAAQEQQARRHHG